MKLFNNDTNKKVVATIDGVEVLQFPYRFKDLPKLLKDVTNYNQYAKLAGEIEDIVFNFQKENFNNRAVKKAYYDSCGSLLAEIPWNGATLFYYDFAQVKAEKFRHTNKALFELISRQDLVCTLDCFFIILQDKSRLILLNEAWDEKEEGSCTVIDVTACIYKAIKERTGATQASFKDYMGTVESLKELQNTLAFVLWDFIDGEGTMTIKELKSAEDLFY